MTRNLTNIFMACLVALSPPGATMVRYSCELTGNTTQIVSSFGAGRHVDACCTGETEAEPLALAGSECCRATVFSLPPTGAAPTHLVANTAPAFVPFDLMAPARSVRLVAYFDAQPRQVSYSRNLPLLI